MESGANTFKQIETALSVNHVTVVSTSIKDGPDLELRNPYVDLILHLWDVKQYRSLSQWIGENYAFFSSSGDGGSRITQDVVSPKSVIVGGVSQDSFLDPKSLTSYFVWGGEGRGKAFFDAQSTSYQRAAQENKSFWRQVPDVTWLAGNPGVITSFNNSWYVQYGTSLAAPCWAALWALADAAHKKMQGTALSSDANQVLYKLAGQSPNTFIKNGIDSKTTKSWSEGWGLGMPNPDVLVTQLAHFNNGQIINQYRFPIELIPFSVILLVFIGSSVTYLILKNNIKKKSRKGIVVSKRLKRLRRLAYGFSTTTPFMILLSGIVVEICKQLPLSSSLRNVPIWISWIAWGTTRLFAFVSLSLISTCFMNKQFYKLKKKRKKANLETKNISVLES